ncbi:Transcriptional regulatory protein OmpR [Roseovarius gaetbuli]|uniref:Regulatory protein VirG n=1 Tax=Roseovarius gaetbuli TaxID=1356575 RepID=A0A1X6Z1Y8_9RHOB|nr:response regulator transcription factor [Roseovarius gaetbuli]SLN38058.1 Transcriptional regulatory protein OmpR [Roseovarius gaetbuli]
MTRKTILVVDDDPKIRTLLRNVLEGEGLGVCEAMNAEEAFEQIKAFAPDLVTLDINLGADNGIEVARAIRATSQVPIIMVSGKDDVIDRVVGLEIGADDYITKPFHTREVVARVRSVLRRSSGPAVSDDPVDAAPVTAQGESGGRYCFDGITVLADRLEVLDRDGTDCGLTTGDFKLLKVFLERPKRVLSRDQLMDLVGGIEWSPLDRTIDNQVARLRKKIERDPSEPKLIKTVRGIGYTFVGDVEITQSSDGATKSA